MAARLNAPMTVLTCRPAASRHGRVALHLACILAGSDLATHWQGISRELRRR